MEDVVETRTTFNPTDLRISWEKGDSVNINGSSFISQNAGASTTLDGYFTTEVRPQFVSSPSGGFQNQEPSMLVDDKGTETKWCANNDHKGGAAWTIIVSTDASYKLQAIKLWNGGDTQKYPGRRWKNVKVSGSASASGTWEELKSFQNLDLVANNGGLAGTLDVNATAPYQYYKIEISDIVDGDTMQMSDMKFLVLDEKITSKYKAIYPSSLYKADHFELPSIQTYAAGKFNAPMYAESETELLPFKNICGVLCLSLKGNSTDKVKYITVIADEGVCGKFTMGSDATTLSLSSTVGEYSRTVSLDCSHVGETTTGAGDGGVELSSTATNFYIYLPPNTYTSGMKIIITNADSKVFEKTTSGSVTIARNNIYTFNNWTLDFKAKPTLLSGVFTVCSSPSKTVKFTRGNLWADGSKVLHFETNQWERIPTSNGSMDNSHVSHFTWSSTVDIAVGTSNSGDNLFCDESQKDNITVDEQSGYYALSKDEWNHLFTGRTSSTSKYGYATVNDVNGIIILPDTYSEPYAGFKAFKPSSTGWSANVYTEPEWIAMESAGAVFLPTTGYRAGSTLTNVLFYGNYCSSSAYDRYSACHVKFDSHDVYPYNASDRNLGLSVRLVAEE